MWPHGVAVGAVLATWCYLMRGADLPFAVLAVMPGVPYAGVVGYRVARWCGVDAGIGAGAACAVTVHVIVFAAAVLLSWWWVLAGALLLPVVAMWGAVCAAAGARWAVSRPDHRGRSAATR